MKYIVSFLFLFCILSCSRDRYYQPQVCAVCETENKGAIYFGNGYKDVVSVFVDDEFKFSIQSGGKKLANCIDAGFHTYRVEYSLYNGSQGSTYDNSNTSGKQPLIGEINVQQCIMEPIEIQDNRTF